MAAYYGLMPAQCGQQDRSPHRHRYPPVTQENLTFNRNKWQADPLQETGYKMGLLDKALEG